MTHTSESLDALDADDRRLPARVAHLSRIQATQEAQILALTQRLDGVGLTMATKEQLENQMKLFTMQLTHQQTTLDLKMTALGESIRKDLEPIKRGIYYAVGIIVSSFLLGALSLIWIKP